MTAEEYAQLGAEVQAAIAGIIRTAAPLAKVLERDPVNLDDAQWLGSLKSDTDLDGTDKRVHAWLVTFAGTEDPRSSTVRAVEPVLPFRVQVFLGHDFGTDADNSEKRVRGEVLKVQMELAKQQRLGGIVGVSKHTDLTMRVRLGRMGDTIVHRGEGELSVELTPITRG